MKNRFINIGYGNVISAEKVVCVISPDSAPIKRLVQEARENGKAVDATYGRKTRAVIIMNNGYIILTPQHVETIAGRLNSEINLDEGTMNG